MVVCADTSFLFSVYGNDRNTSRAIDWVKATRLPVTISLLNEYELGNALRFAEFRKYIGRGDAARFWSQFEADLADGRLLMQVCNLASVIKSARRISATRTLHGGHRGFDILHVAAALQLGAEQFLTFDENQKKVAALEGLQVPA